VFEYLGLQFFLSRIEACSLIFANVVLSRF